MVTIFSFEHAYHLYREGRIPLRLLQEQGLVVGNYSDTDSWAPSAEVSTTSLKGIADAFDLGDGDIESLLGRPEASEGYNGLLGGAVHVCQTEDDLKQIEGMDMEWAETHGGKWPNVTDKPMSWDQCDYLKEKRGDSQWVVFLLCWNDAGGPVFYVPRHLWKQARVQEHIEETNGFWKSAR